MQLRLPLRLSARIALATAGRPSRCRPRQPHRHRRCTARRQAQRQAGRQNSTVEVHGRGLIRGLVEAGSGEPIPRAAVALSEQLRTGGGFRQLTTLRADALGRFAYRIGPGPSRTIRFHYAGTALVKPAASDVKVLVPARSSIAVDRRRVFNGDEVVFNGALRGGFVPEGGKLMDLQAYYRGGWRTFATARTDTGGRWAYRYRFGATRGLIRYRFRARIRREAAYPFELGYSSIVRVTVRG